VALSRGSGLAVFPLAAGNKPLYEDADAILSGADWSVSDAGGLLIAASRSRSEVRIWRTGPWERLDTGGSCQPNAAAAAPGDGVVVVECSGEVRVIDVASGRIAARWPGKGLALASSQRSVVLRQGRRVELRRLDDGGLLAATDLPVELERPELSLSPDGRWLAAVSRQAVALYALPRLERVALEQRTSASALPAFTGALSFSPDSRLLLAHGGDRLYLFDVQPWRARLELIHPGEASAVHWSLRERRLYARVSDRPEGRDDQHTARIWDLDSGAELARIGLTRLAQRVLPDASGRFLLADQLYPLAPTELLRVMCTQMLRNLTRREWQLELGALPYRRTCDGLPEPPATIVSWDQ
jgi:hypothetical protein